MKSGFQKRGNNIKFISTASQAKAKKGGPAPAKTLAPANAPAEPAKAPANTPAPEAAPAPAQAPATKETGEAVTNIENFKFIIDGKKFELNGETIQKLLKDEEILPAVKENYKEEVLKSDVQGKLSEKVPSASKKRDGFGDEQIDAALEKEAANLGVNKKTLIEDKDYAAKNNITVEQLQEYQKTAKQSGTDLKDVIKEAKTAEAIGADQGNWQKTLRAPIAAAAASQAGGGIKDEEIDIISLKIGDVDLKDKFININESNLGEAAQRQLKLNQEALTKSDIAKQAAADARVQGQKNLQQFNPERATPAVEAGQYLAELRAKRDKLNAEMKANNDERREAELRVLIKELSDNIQDFQDIRKEKVEEEKKAKKAKEGMSGPLSRSMNPGFTGTKLPDNQVLLDFELRAKKGGGGKKNKIVDNLPIPGSKSGMKHKKTKRGKIGGNKKQTRKK